MQIVRIIVVRIVIAAIAMTTGATSASAQRGAPPRPSSGGLFGATRPDVGNRNKLNFTFDVAEAYDSALPVGVGGPVLQGPQNGGASTLLYVMSEYRYDRRRFGVSGTASTSLRYFQDLDQLDAMGHSAGITASVKVPKGSLQLDQGFAYSPSYLYQLFPVEIPLESSIPVNPDYRIAQTDSRSSRTGAALSFGSDRGTQLKARGGFNRTDFDQQDFARLDMEVYDASLDLTRRVTSSGRFTAGYTFRTSNYGSQGPSKEHGLKIGVEYSPALSRTRRLVLRLDVTPTRLELPASAVIVPAQSAITDVSADAGVDAAAVPDAPAADAHLFRMSAEASISYPIRRNWSTSARYRRSVEYVAVIGQPLLPDGASVELSGLITRRLDLTATAGYFAATSSISAAQALDSSTGQVTVRYALKRWIGLSSQYLYYRYDMRDTVVIGSPLPARFSQHGVRVGAVLFLEALR